MQSDSREVLPVLLVVWPEGHWRQDAEPGAGWYLEMGQSLHDGGTTAQSLKPTLRETPTHSSDLKVNVVAIPDAAMDAGGNAADGVMMDAGFDMMDPEGMDAGNEGADMGPDGASRVVFVARK